MISSSIPNGQRGKLEKRLKGCDWWRFKGLMQLLTLTYRPVGWVYSPVTGVFNCTDRGILVIGRLDLLVYSEIGSIGCDDWTLLACLVM